MRLEGKRAFISAAAHGIGRETALAFAREGAKVVATDINEAALAVLGDGHANISTSLLDVTDPSAISSFFNANSGFDVVFNCAGYVANGSILECERDDWQRSFAINVDSMYEICRAVLPSLVESGGGSIINMSSIASSVKGIPNRFAYGATKGAVVGMTKAIAADFVAEGVRCNAICPGTVRTPSLEQRITDLPGEFEDNWNAFVARQPMGRLGNTDEIAALAVYLASDESKFTTGTTHVIDGGWVN